MNCEKKNTAFKSSHPDQKPPNGLNITPLQGFQDSSRVITGSSIFLGESLFQALEEISKEKKMLFSLPHAYIDYVPPKLHKAPSGWYISYYVKNPDTGKLKLFRTKVNQFRGPERTRAAREIMAALQERLAMGWSPLTEKVAPLATTPAFEVFDRYERVKTKEMEKQSLATYLSYIRVFRTFLLGIGFLPSTSILAIKEDTAKRYMDFLETERGVSPRSYNNYLSFQVTFFDWMKDKGYIAENPFLSIKRKPKRLMTKKRRMLTDDELLTLFKWLHEHNPEYLAVCLLCYCCFMRPKEIALLRCCDLDLRRQLVHVRAEIAKNDRESFRTIPDAVMPVFRSLDLRHPDWYLFGNHPGVRSDFRPAKEPGAKKRFSDYWATTVREACGFSMEVQFYSQKDTGITNMLGEGVAINLVQQQADHASVAMTALYVGHKATAQEELKKAGSLVLQDPAAAETRR